jgi:hypothetical protein
MTRSRPKMAPHPPLLEELSDLAAPCQIMSLRRPDL